VEKNHFFLWQFEWQANKTKVAATIATIIMWKRPGWQLLPLPPPKKYPKAAVYQTLTDFKSNEFQ